MRTIKFRGKSVDKNEWVYGDLFHCESRMFIGNVDFYAVAEGLELENLKEVDSETIGQFTGLYDKNGNEIWEGDIIEMKEEDSFCKVVYRSGYFAYQFFPKGDILICGYDSCKNNIRIIGNIHDTPNLLQQ